MTDKVDKKSKDSSGSQEEGNSNWYGAPAAYGYPGYQQGQEAYQNYNQWNAYAAAGYYAVSSNIHFIEIK